MRIETNVKVTVLGVVCPDCGNAVDDRDLLDIAQTMRWVCPFCGAKHISLREEAKRSVVIENACTDEPEEEEDKSVVSEMVGVEEIERLRAEFLTRTSL